MEARKRIEVMPDDEVRFVECDRAPGPQGEAFSLGDPVYVAPGPVATEARFYSAGKCEHNGGSVANFTLFYEANNIDAAIACSRARCQANDAIGCRDLGALHWLDVLPAVEIDEAQAATAFQAGCQLGDADSCASLAQILRKRKDVARALALDAAACRAAAPDIDSCRAVGEYLLDQGSADEAKPFLLRGCRGTTAFQQPYAERREGCDLLADLAEKRGDVASQWEYLRLTCAYGYGKAHACDRYGFMMLRRGDRGRALPYLRKACGVLPAQKLDSADACHEVERR